VGVGLLGLAVGTITLLLGAVTGKHSITMAVAALVALAGYLANNFAEALQASKGSISTALKTLVTMRWVDKNSRPGDRKELLLDPAGRAAGTDPPAELACTPT
jgi:DNA-binding MarR family transcriptional regulator